MLGYQPEELIGVNAFDLVHETDRDLIRNLLDLILNKPSKSVSAEFRCRAKNGTWQWTEGVGKNLSGDRQWELSS